MKEKILRRPTPQRAVLWGLFSLACMGCGGAVSVNGMVEYAGAPVEQGIVQFQPQEGRPVSTEVKAGRYEFREDAGLQPGTHTVRLFAQKETGRWSVNPDKPGSKAPEDRVKDVVEYLPPKYNYETELQVTLSDGPNERDFKLGK